MLLGKIQSGKTRAFIGVIALCFDNDYDIAIVLTKATNPLSEQTMNRLQDDFEDSLEDKVQVHDIMAIPDHLSKYEIDQKMIIVAKKEINNLRRLRKVLIDQYPDLKSKKILFVDDEADFASIGYRRDRESGDIEPGKISKAIDDLRSDVNSSSYLQVTATPYSLYLQPDEDAENVNALFIPKKPSFTQILPVHSNYVGGDYYFIKSQEEGTVPAYTYQEVQVEELNNLKAKKSTGKADGRSFKLDDVLTSDVTIMLRESIMNFIVGGRIRIMQQRQEGIKEEKFSFIIHTEQSKTSHDWQESLVSELTKKLSLLAKENTVDFRAMVEDAYHNISKSVSVSGKYYLPSFQEVYDDVCKTLEQEMIVVEKVNSEKDVKALLDNKGQLKLRTPLNIFIGGQILDRGITIKNLIGFFYGRNPKNFQQDTVLQHSRMYGARPAADLAVTRFYTSMKIFETMRKINEFDEALRDAFLSGSHDKGVYFIRKDIENRLVPCSPNKILLSKIVTLQPGKRLLPIGFQTDYKTKIKKTVEEIDTIVETKLSETNLRYFQMPVEDVINIIEKINDTYVFEEDGYDWNVKSFKASLEYLSKNTAEAQLSGNVYIVIQELSKISRKRPSDGRFSDSPDGGSSINSPINIARSLANDIPAVILTKVEGSEDRGWRGGDFWWPVLVAQKNIHTTIYAEEEKT